MYSLPYDLKRRLNGQKEIQQCVFVNLVGMFFAALSSSGVSICLVLLHRLVFTFSSKSTKIDSYKIIKHLVRRIQ